MDNIVNKQTRSKTKAFTLAEVLITLVIIGVIAAITIVSLVANYTEQEKYSRVKKAYSTLSNAMTRAKADGGDTVFNIVDGDNEYMKNWYDTYLKQYLITTKICYNESGCWNNGVTKTLSGATASSSSVGVGSNLVTVILNDGTLVNFDAGPASVFSAASYRVDVDTVGAMAVYFDINGIKAPNTIGKDIFVAVYTDSGLVPAYKDATKAQIDSDCSKTGRGASCIQKYLKFDKQ